MASPPSVYEPFLVLSDPSTLGLRWPPYLRRLENMFTCFAITDSTQKKSLLLYYSGVEVSDIFDTLTVASGEGVDVYKAATDALTAHFAPSKNTEYERFLFRDAKQSPGETMDAFHKRLQRMAKSCSFHDKNAEVKSQIIKGCLSTRIRRRALRETLSLKDLLDTAHSYELAEYQASGMERHKIGQTSSMPAVNVESQSVNKLSSQKKFRKKSSDNRNSKKSRECYFCGGIYPHTNVCPAKDKNCRYCNETGHFEKCCHERKRDTKSEQVRTVQSEIKTEQSHEPEHAVESDTSDEYLFAVRNSKAPACTVGIGIILSNY